MLCWVDLGHFEKKKKKDLWYCNPNPYSWSAKACNSADYQITWKAFRMTVCVHLCCSWQSNNPLYIKHKTAQLHDALHHLTHIAAHGALSFKKTFVICHSRAYKHIYLKRPNDIIWWETSAHLLCQQMSAVVLSFSSEGHSWLCLSRPESFSDNFITL